MTPLALSALVHLAASALSFEPPFLVESGGEPIRLSVGHAAPTLHDLDGDGVRDLLVGEFGGGGIRFYRNLGTDFDPKFDGFTMVEADGKPIRVDAG